MTDLIKFVTNDSTSDAIGKDPHTWGSDNNTNKIIHATSTDDNEYANTNTISIAENNIVEMTMSYDIINQQAEQMLNDYRNSILRLAYSYLHNMSDAEEIVQGTIIQSLKTTPTFLL